MFCITYAEREQNGRVSTLGSFGSVSSSDIVSVFSTTADFRAVINAWLSYDWKKTDQFADALLQAGYGVEGLMLNNVYVRGKGKAAREAAAMDIYNQISSKGGNSVWNDLGKGVNAVSAGGNATWFLNRHAGTSSRYGVRMPNGRVVSGTAFNRLGRMAVHKGLTALGKKLSVLSIGLTVVDGLTYNWKEHHTADVVATSVLLILGTYSAPAAAIGGLIYFAIDLGVSCYTGYSITENLFEDL